MRISTSGAYQSGLNLIQQLQSALDRTQRQIASGRALLSPADDPIASARAVELRESLSRIEQFERNSEAARSRLSHEETALTSVNDVLQRVRELALQANSDTQSNESRKLIAVELRDRADQLVALANQRDGAGRYLFSGNLDGNVPVVRSGANYSYNGDQGQRLIQIGEGRQIADGDSGAEVFFLIKDGNGTFSTGASGANNGTGIVATTGVSDASQYDQGSYTLTFPAPDSVEIRDSGGSLVSTAAFQSGDTIAFRGIELSIDGLPQTGDVFTVSPSRNQDAFSNIRDLASALESDAGDDASRAQLHNRVNNSLLNVDQALGQVLNVRTQIGTRLEALDNQLDNNGAFELALQETLGSIENLDYAEALSRLSIQTTILEAAQQTFVRTQGLSLFNFL